MEKKQYNEIVESLVLFIKRVSSGRNASPAEVAALPEIVKVLFDITTLQAI